MTSSDVPVPATPSYTGDHVHLIGPDRRTAAEWLALSTSHITDAQFTSVGPDPAAVPHTRLAPIYDPWTVALTDMLARRAADRVTRRERHVWIIDEPAAAGVSGIEATRRLLRAGASLGVQAIILTADSAPSALAETLALHAVRPALEQRPVLER